MPRFAVLAAFLTIAAAPVPQWAFPGFGAGVDASAPEAGHGVRLAGSRVVFQAADFEGMARAIDWFPDAHPPAPDVVMRARGQGGFPCGYCHLVNGTGRPENARLAGLPADYIVEQVKAFAAGARRSASPDYAPTHYMEGVAHALGDADLAAAAAYFSQFEPQTHTRVVESATIPGADMWHFVYRFDDRRREALGQRIVEGPADLARFELRDPGTPYTAYVPEGAIARGRNIAEHGVAGGPACESCHGTALAGIAGASPSYLARQLMGFRSKARNDPGAAPMQEVAARLTDAEIIDAAAYVGSRPAWTRAELAATMIGK